MGVAREVTTATYLLENVMAAKPSRISIDTKEAVNRLAHPTFFDHEQRAVAYDIVMREGNEKQKASAEQARVMWPIDGLKLTA